MEKKKDYANARFSTETLKECFARAQEIARRSKAEPSFRALKVEHDDATWKYDSFDEFLADYRKFGGHAYIAMAAGDVRIDIWFQHNDTTLIVEAPTRADIESVFELFEGNLASAALPAPAIRKARPVVFIGHGRSAQWRDLKDHLQDKHGFKIEAYETGARAGHTIRDILEEMASKSTFALLVLTGEDETSDGGLRARQNVVHEAGLFQGKLGFSRAILLLEEGVEDFSNVHGVQYIQFAKGKIRESFGEVLATLRREFPNDG